MIKIKLEVRIPLSNSDPRDCFRQQRFDTTVGLKMNCRGTFIGQLGSKQEGIMANLNSDEKVIYHVVHDASTNCWVVARENGDFRQEFDRKKDAEKYGKELAEKATLGQLKVHKRNGKMDYKITYNQHPVSSRS